MAKDSAELGEVIATLLRLENCVIAGELDVHFDVTDCTKATLAILGPIISREKKANLTPCRLTRIATDHASVVAYSPQWEMDIYESIVANLSKMIQKNFVATQELYATAVKENRAVARTTMAKAMLKLNRVAFHAKANGREIVMFPDRPFRWIADPMDPAEIECPVPLEVRWLLISGARVKGISEADSRKLGPYERDAEMDWVIYLDHKIGKIVHQMTRQAAEVIFQQGTFISARVEGSGKGILRVVGDLEIERRNNS